MLTYTQRIPFCSNPLGAKLLQLMVNKETNLALSADVVSKRALLELAEKAGPHICVLKTHIDIIEDFDQELVTELKAIATRHDFLVFEDRKFADIGNTVKLQYAKGIYRIADWADLVTVHAVPGPGVLQGLKAVGETQGRAALLLVEMSAAGNLAKGDYSLAALQMAKEHRDFVMGFITQHCLLDDPGFIHFTPGVQLQTGGDSLGQQYITPEQAIIEGQNDIIIVGRGIYAAENPEQSAIAYREAGWKAYKARLKDQL